MQKQLQKVILESNEGKLNEKYMEDIELIMLDIKSNSIQKVPFWGQDIELKTRD